MTAAPNPGPPLTTARVFEVGALGDAYRSGALTPADVIREVGRRIAARGDDGVWIAARRRRRTGGGGGIGQRAGCREAAVGNPVRGEGQHRCRGLGDHRGLPGVRLRARRDGDRRSKAPGCRRHPRRKDQPGSVRDRPQRNPVPLRHPPIRLGPGDDLRRIQLRQRGRRRRRPGGLRPRHRHRRLRQGPGGPQRDRRPQAEPGPREHRGSGARLSEPRLRERLRPLRPRSHRGGRHHGRCGQGRSVVTHAGGTGGSGCRSQRPATGHSRGPRSQRRARLRPRLGCGTGPAHRRGGRADRGRPRRASPRPVGCSTRDRGSPSGSPERPTSSRTTPTRCIPSSGHCWSAGTPSPASTCSAEWTACACSNVTRLTCSTPSTRCSPPPPPRPSPSSRCSRSRSSATPDSASSRPSAIFSISPPSRSRPRPCAATARSGCR